jgi:hypothetical protein
VKRAFLIRSSWIVYAPVLCRVCARCVHGDRVHDWCSGEWHKISSALSSRRRKDALKDFRADAPAGFDLSGLSKASAQSRQNRNFPPWKGSWLASINYARCRFQPKATPSPSRGVRHSRNQESNPLMQNCHDWCCDPRHTENGAANLRGALSNFHVLRTQGSQLLRCMSLLLALSGHSHRTTECPLLGVKRTCQVTGSMSAYDPKRTSGLP